MYIYFVSGIIPCHILCVTVEQVLTMRRQYLFGLYLVSENTVATDNEDILVIPPRIR